MSNNFVQCERVEGQFLWSRRGERLIYFETTLMRLPSADVRYTKMAIAKARQGALKGQSPFGAVIVRKGEVLACEHNKVWKVCDITAHAEITAIRAACKKVGAIDLTGSTIYTTCEPCPMCFGAIHWARISRVVFGCSIKDAKEVGFCELTISAKRLRSMGKSPVTVTGGILKEECIDVLRLWKELGGKPY
jgi:tRNA(Arg) A34 adenosine deaminase TadA